MLWQHVYLLRQLIFSVRQEPTPGPWKGSPSCNSWRQQTGCVHLKVLCWEWTLPTSAGRWGKKSSPDISGADLSPLAIQSLPHVRKVREISASFSFQHHSGTRASYEILAFQKQWLQKLWHQRMFVRASETQEARRGRCRRRPQHVCSSSIFIYKQQFPLTLYHKKAIYKQEARVQNKIKQHWNIQCHKSKTKWIQEENIIWINSLKFML